MDVADPPFMLVGVNFDLGVWAEKLKKKHPEWSDKRARCCLYWQGKVRKVLREKCEDTVHQYKVIRGLHRKDIMIFYNPEAMGVQVFKTCELVGIHLERNPQDIVWKIAIIARRR